MSKVDGHFRPVWVISIPDDWSNAIHGMDLCEFGSNWKESISLKRLSSSASSFNLPGMWVMWGYTWYRRMNWKYGVSTAAKALVIVRPLAEAASAALLSVAWWHAMGPRVKGKWASMQNESANCARSSHAAICFCMSSPSHGHSDWASANDIRNWNHVEEPSGKNAAPPNPAMDCVAIASAVAWTCIHSGGHIDSENGVEINSCDQIFRASTASSSSLRFGVEGSERPTQMRRDLMCRDLTSGNVLTFVLATRHKVTPFRSDWCLWVNWVCSCNWSSTCAIKVWKVTWSIPTIVIGMRCRALYSGIRSGRRCRHADVSHKRRPTSDCKSRNVRRAELCMDRIWAVIFSSFSKGTSTVQEETEIRQPIQSMVSESAALCQDMGTPRMSNRTTINDAQRSEEDLSNQASRSSTYCQRAWPWANKAWQDRTMMPANRPQYQPLARAPKLRVMHLYSSPFAWKHSRPPSSGWTKILRWAFATSRVSCVICCSAMPSGAHWITSDMRGNSIWFGNTVLAVTMLMELSTTKRGERPGAKTTPSLPMAVLEYICLSAGTPPGTWAMKPASSSSWIRDCTISGWSCALFQLSRQSWSGTSSGSVPECCGHAGEGVRGWLTPKCTPFGNWRRTSASGSCKNDAKRCHNFSRNGWPGEMSKRKSPGGQSSISSMSST